MSDHPGSLGRLKPHPLDDVIRVSLRERRNEFRAAAERILSAFVTEDCRDRMRVLKVAYEAAANLLDCFLTEFETSVDPKDEV